MNPDAFFKNWLGMTAADYLKANSHAGKVDFSLVKADLAARKPKHDALLALAAYTIQKELQAALPTA